MDFLAALDILLALSLIYLVFALVVTSLNESIAALLSSRARWLRRGWGLRGPARFEPVRGPCRPGKA